MDDSRLLAARTAWPSAPCRYFAAGRCFRGNRCRFAHPLAGQEPQTPSPSPIPCRFFAKGRCNKGDACRYAHDGVPASQQNLPASGIHVEEERPDEAVLADLDPCDTGRRNLRGAQVSFGDGAAVAKVSLLSDSSAVRLTGLPEGSTPSSVVALLSGMRAVAFPADVSSVHVTQDGPGCTADVVVKDPGFVRRASAKLPGRTSPAPASHLEAVPIPVPGQRALVDRKVVCSWDRSTRKAWLTFPRKADARKVYEGFKTGAYRVQSCRVKAAAPRREYPAFAVVLTDLPGAADMEDLYDAVPTSCTPSRIELGWATYDAAQNVAACAVESMLRQFGPVDRWEVSANPQRRRIKAEARFADESHARRAVSALNGAPLPFNKGGKLTAQLVTSAEFKTATRIHGALRLRLAAQAKVWEGESVHFTAYPLRQGYRVLKVEGEDSQAVARAKAALERLLDGEVARKDGRDVWSASLLRNGDLYKALSSIERAHGVTIERDRQKSQLRVFGPEGRASQVAEAVDALIARETANDSGHHVIELSPGEFEWARGGGFAAVAWRLGDDKAVFDMTATPKRILIAGSRADYATAVGIVANRQTGPVPAAPSDSRTEDNDCAVCWTEAEDAIRTSCGHVYCAACFADLCGKATSSTTAAFSGISCLGDQGECREVFPLAELKTLLPPATFEGVLEASFDRHIATNPAALRYCPTPDCGHIYRPHREWASAREMLCPGCLVTLCTACHAAHPNHSCADYQDVSSGRREAVERLKAELGIKDCPGCRTAIEKTFGCNHMTCSGCGAHLCWLCLASFASAEACYRHLVQDGEPEPGQIFEGLEFPWAGPAGGDEADDGADDEEEAGEGEVLFRV
ncbi:hypothetical protein C8A03DRAFT_48030 [Achaetomium macrosporum]|uniref:RING-type E3 ubiquitin transferase n=1 Tax=Achaetomium macrosporum TaxID=79813 RepID=A0AAN7C164_9PEZI|nr:hypothetical protein C8A03DRAFT_48030 [Achaetomium macrosporum]